MPMAKPSFSEIQTWVFDLDNTLYHPSVRLFDQIERRMTDWVMTALNVDRPRADFLRQDYWQRYGTTLAGLMAEHDVDPAPYLHEVHDIDFSALAPDPELAQTLSDLPGRVIVYTNGCTPYAEKVLQGRGLSGVFDAIYGVEHADFLPKPDRAAFEKVFEKDGVNPARSAMFEDDPRNLLAPHEMGMATVLVSETAASHEHIDHATRDLHHFLKSTQEH